MSESNNVKTVNSKKGLMIRGQRVTCGSNKTQFMKGDATGGNSINSAINRLPFEIHLSGHNFTGPHTKLDERLNAEGTSKN